MPSSKLKVGMLVEHPKRPNWGPGKLVALSEGRAYVFFRDEPEQHAKSILTELVSLQICKNQEDAVLDVLPAASFQDGNWVLQKGKHKPKVVKPAFD